MATVWYVFTPATDGRFLIENTGSSYDTTLGLHRGSPGDLRPITCHDDDAGRNERMVRNLIGGRTYYIEAGTCCVSEETDAGQVGPGGDLVLRVSVGPPEMSAVARVARAKAARFGAARIHGNARCRPDATWANVWVSVRQRQGNDVVIAQGGRRVPCTARRQAWTVLVEHESRALQRKPALVRWTLSACDDFTCDDTNGRRVVRVR